MSRHFQLFKFLLLAFLVRPEGILGATITVGKDGASDHSTITAAMSAAKPRDTMLVQGGVYDSTGGEVFPILIKNEVALVAQAGSPAEVVGDGQSSVFEGRLLDGFNMIHFIIKGGGGSKGGGLHLSRNSEASISDCTFTENTVVFRQDVIPSGIGHAIFIDDSTLSIHRCSFLENGLAIEPAESGGGYVVAAVGPVSPSHLLVRNSTFERNRGAILCRDQSRLHVIDSLILHNQIANGSDLVSGINFESADECEIFGCKVEDNLGGGISLGGSAVAKIDFSMIIGNSGPGILSSSQGTEHQILHSTIAGNGKGRDSIQTPVSSSGLDIHADRIVLDGCRIYDNRGYGGKPGGGKIQGDLIQVTNTEVFGNHAEDQSNTIGGMVIRGSTVEVHNSTFSGNTKEPFGPFDYSELEIEGSILLRIVNSIIYNASQAMSVAGPHQTLEYCNLSQLIPGEGNIFTDPQFLHPWDGEFADLRLPCDSPAVDAGTLEGAPTRDIEGVTRPRGSGVDMGAYENCHFDVNGDRSEDRRDVVSFTAEWYRPIDETNFGFDLDRLPPSTGRIDRLDLDQLLEAVK